MSDRFVDTLYIFGGNRSTYPLTDLAMAAAWTSRGSYEIWLVPAQPVAGWAGPVIGGRACCRVVPGLANVRAGFNLLEGLRHALVSGLRFRRAILSRDHGMIIGPGLDEFVGEQLERSQSLALGVRNTDDVTDVYRSILPYLYSQQIAHEHWERPPTALRSDILGLSYAGATNLWSAHALDASRWPAWTTSVGSYVSWLLQFTGGTVVCWGSDDKVLPPLYVGVERAPAPHLLSHQFLFFSSAMGVCSYSERDLRELYKRERGEPAAKVSTYGPLIAGEGR